MNPGRIRIACAAKLTRSVAAAVASAIFVGFALTGCMSLEAGAHDLAFFKLVQKGTPQDVEAAIRNGAEVNDRSKSGFTPLMAAARSNPRPGVISALLQAGADVNAHDGFDETPLLFACQNNANPDVIITLLEAGADINARDKSGWTPLMYAAALNPQAGLIIRTLLKEGADANVRDSLGRAAIDIARGNHMLNANPVVQQLEQATK